jgi:hypothetical protein
MISILLFNISPKPVNYLLSSAFRILLLRLTSQARCFNFARFPQHSPHKRIEHLNRNNAIEVLPLELHSDGDCKNRNEVIPCYFYFPFFLNTRNKGNNTVKRIGLLIETVLPTFMNEPKKSPSVILLRKNATLLFLH